MAGGGSYVRALQGRAGPFRTLAGLARAGERKYGKTSAASQRRLLTLVPGASQFASGRFVQIVACFVRPQASAAAAINDAVPGHLLAAQFGKASIPRSGRAATSKVSECHGIPDQAVPTSLSVSVEGLSVRADNDDANKQRGRIKDPAPLQLLGWQPHLRAAGR
jgi:hypothetical protein